MKWKLRKRGGIPETSPLWLNLQNNPLPASMAEALSTASCSVIKALSISCLSFEQVVCNIFSSPRSLRFSLIVTSHCLDNKSISLVFSALNCSKSFLIFSASGSKRTATADWRLVVFLILVPLFLRILNDPIDLSDIDLCFLPFDG